MMKIKILDGVNTIGGNKILVSEYGENYLLDFGMNFNLYKKYFEEFMKERSRRGIYDLWKLNLIPRYNIYRKDLIPSDLVNEINGYENPKINGIFISHGHLDHTGNIALLDENIPVLGTPETMLILKSLSDISKGGMGMEIPFFNVRKREDYILKSGDEINSRDIYLSEKISDKTYDFLSQKFVKKKDVNSGIISDIDGFNSRLEMNIIKVDHSIYGSSGIFIKGDISIAYTGDFRLHGKYSSYSYDFINRVRDAEILIVEGTRISRENDENLSEDDVYRNALSIAQDTKNLIIADFSSRNFERLETFKRIAEKTSRNLIVTKKDAFSLYALDTYKNENILKDLMIYDEKSTRTENWERFLDDNINNELLSPLEIRKNQEKYILCFSFYDLNELLDIEPLEKSSYIYSSSEAFGEEDYFSFERLLNWLEFFKLDVYGIKRTENGIDFPKGLHASGHVSGNDLFKVIENIDPERIIPVHTTNPEWFRKNFPEKAILPEIQKEYSF